MPDMYYSDAYEPYSEPYPNYKKNIKRIRIPIFLQKGTSSLPPVKETVPRNYYGLIQESKNNKKIFLSLKKKEISKKFVEEGKNLYRINCSICHGDQGDGQGLLVKNEKILGIPSYKDRNITIESIYHVITYGKNNMNSYASQLNEIDRWKVAEYVMYLKNK
jgi:mono/diheme cytochrome c family protein